MKQKLVVYLAGLLTVVGLGFGQAQFSDVPAGHWAKEAVDRITSCGLIIGFPDGTFRGNQNLTRYQAALIFQRLLTELQNGGQCVNGGKLSNEDLTAIRNGVQELAAELAALGVRVSALEDNSASKDDIARLDAAIQDLKNAQGQGMDQAALKDLADRVEAASVAADTALAQSQVLGERLDTVQGDLAAVKTEADANADSIKALNELAVLLNQDVLSLQDRVTALESTVGNVNVNDLATKEDVNAVQEFSTALRGDLVNLTDKVNGIDTRVQKLEAVTLTVTGSVSAVYGYAVSSGFNFDIDRLFPGNQLSSGTGPQDGGNFFRPAVRRGDFNQNYATTNNNGPVAATLNFGLKYNNVTGDTGITDATVSTKFDTFAAQTDIFNFLRLSSAVVNGRLAGSDFKINYSDASKFIFNPYLFSNNFDDNGAIGKRGIVATLDAKGAPLAPKFTVVVGQAVVFNGGNNNILNGAYAGIRAEGTLAGLTFGLSYVDNHYPSLGGGTGGAVNGSATGSSSATGQTAFGLDWKGSLFNFLNLEGAYVASKAIGQTLDLTNSATNPQAFYIKAGVNLGILSLNGNYRAIAPGFANGVAGMSSDSANYYFGLGGYDTAPYAADSKGFGLDGKVTLGILSGIELRGYYDNATNLAGAANTATTYFGVGGDIGLFAGFKLNAFFNNFTVNGNQFAGSGFDLLPGNGGAIGNFGNFDVYTYNGQDSRYSSGFGVKLIHDGKANNALIKGLDLNLWYQQFSNAGAGIGSDILAAAAYNGKLLGFLTVNPIIRYHSFSASGPTSYTDYDGTTIPIYSYSTFKFGVGVTTDPLGIFLKPGLDGTYSTRSTNFTSGPAPLNNASETFWKAGINLNEFFATGSVLKVGYANYSATNVLNASNPLGALTATLPLRGYTNAPLSATTDRIFSYPGEVQYPWNATVTGTGSTTGGVGGLYVEWAYGNLTTAAFVGSVTDANGNGVSQGSAFKIAYTVNF